ncbi:NADPH:quinone oxidoreductase family protein [uncultured Desulfosarcina sp.]|uniref:NADPH:quinone oxidoreductase family protein n=1 Tax=uncultured Desulfosarcina sp. TaxID=218289 RepID=UPI0029C61EE8|nr:NADPH:quinone oxidoreductase family protein [uncultured Desulfosarcina sp.]
MPIGREKMLAWQITQFGKFEDVLQLKSCALPCASSGEAVVEVNAIGLNYLDILAIAGKYQEKGTLPFIPGVEAAGRVVETGSGSSFQVGDRVMAFGQAACAAYMVSEPGNTFILPENMTYEEAAAFQLTYQTAHMALALRARLDAGEWLLVHAGAGGVGTAAIQIGCALGAKVVATAGSDEKLEICRRAGAEVAVNYRENSFCRVIQDVTEGRGADVIFDPVGGPIFEESTRCIAFEGRIVTIGYASGIIPSITLNRILLKNMDVIGLFWGNYRHHDPRRIEQTQSDLNRLWAAGKIRPIIYRQFAFDDYPQALAALAGRKSFGKVVLKGQKVDS